MKKLIIITVLLLASVSWGVEYKVTIDHDLYLKLMAESKKLEQKTGEASTCWALLSDTCNMNAAFARDNVKYFQNMTDAIKKAKGRD